MREIIQAIVQKHKKEGIEVNAPATTTDIYVFEQQVGFRLPEDIATFYTVCNGFGCNEDLFNMTSLADITTYRDNYGLNWFYFSEYMIASDSWGVRLVANGTYEIFNSSYPIKALTTSLEEFLNRFLQGNVFDDGGLYDWHEELKIAE